MGDLFVCCLVALYAVQSFYCPGLGQCLRQAISSTMKRVHSIREVEICRLMALSLSLRPSLCTFEYMDSSTGIPSYYMIHGFKTAFVPLVILYQYVGTQETRYPYDAMHK